MPPALRNALTATALVLLVGAFRPAVAADPRPNVVLILLDNCGQEWLIWLFSRRQTYSTALVALL